MHANSNTFADVRFAINRRIKPDAYRSIFTIIFTSLSKEDERRGVLSFLCLSATELLRNNEIILVVKRDGKKR